MILPLALGLAALLGFAAHRASLCSVRAVAEVLASGRAHLLASFAKTALWATAVSLPWLWLWPDSGMSAPAYALGLGVLAGGFLFGIGAALNGGCAFSTLGYLAEGELTMLATLAGFVAGLAAWFSLAPIPALAPPQAMPSWLATGTLQLILIVPLWLWGGRELYRLWRSRVRHIGWRRRLGAEYYRLSAAALLIGVASGVLYTLYGAWTYTTVFKHQVGSVFEPVSGPPMSLLALGLALLAGMLLSSWQRGSFRLRWQGGGLRRFAGGLLMGLGGALIPGGNDELILRAIPALSPHALPAYLALLAGIACALLLGRLKGRTVRVVCEGDMCRSG